MKRISDRDILMIGCGVLGASLLVILLAVTLILGGRMVASGVNLQIEHDKFVQDVQQINAVGGIDNYVKYKEVGKCPR